ncbi:MAG: redoxin domain-containing protein [Chloroflexi bacterium]|nr:redoxin domain-containing protein [Chloroflexota bacterium]
MTAITQPVLAVGDRVPDVTLPTIDGATLSLRALEGRRVLLFCWASW